MARKSAFVLPIDVDPCPTLEVERGPGGQGVGRWVPDDKHTLLAKWQGGTRYAWRKWPERVYIDPFCGPGRVQVVGEQGTRDGGAVIAWRRSQIVEAPFTKVLVGDINSQRSSACAARLMALHAPVTRFCGPALQTVLEMVAMVPKSALVLAYVDPYNLSYLAFDILNALATLPKVDLLVHFSTMDLQRNVDMELDGDRARFDAASPGWRDRIGGDSLNKAGLRQAFFEDWVQQVTNLGFTMAKQAPQIRGPGNAPLYRLMMFSRHPMAHTIWDDIAKPTTLELF